MSVTQCEHFFLCTHSATCASYKDRHCKKELELLKRNQRLRKVAKTVEKEDMTPKEKQALKTLQDQLKGGKVHCVQERKVPKELHAGRPYRCGHAR